MNDFGILIAQYNSVLPTLTDGQFSELQVDASGRLLVQADVSVVIDFLGLNGAGDSSNILIVGTEDGTAVGTPHVVRLAANGAVIVDDGGGSLTVDATDFDIRDLSSATDSVEVLQDTHDDLNANANIQVGDVDVSNGNPVPVSDAGGSLTVDATDLDIRDLSATQDNVAISDGTDTLEINPDGSINTVSTQTFEGAEEYNATDDLAAAADGLVTITASGTPFVEVVAIPVGAGETLHVYGMDWTCDQNAQARLITDDGVDVIVYKQSLNSSAMPDQFKYWGEAGRIEIAGAAGLEVKIEIKKRSQGGGDALGSGSIHARKLT